jgi:hypothetical protein
MKTTRIFILRSSLFVLATLFVLGSFFLGIDTAKAQTASDAHAAAAQSANAFTSAPVIKPVARITQKIDETKLVALPRSVHPAIRSSAAIDQGVVPDAQRMGNIVLDLQRSPEQEAALRNLLDAQQTKSSSNYHAWLTPAQFAGQFGVADADIQALTNWLAQKGFTDVKVQPGNMFIEFSGTVGLVRNAFHTEVHSFLVNGQKHYANVSDPQIPAALAPVIAKVHSLHDFRKRSFSHFSKVLEQAKAKAVASGANFTLANVCGTGGTQPCAAVGPGDLATIYNIPATVAGSPAGQGQTVAIVARSNIAISDINQFGSAFGIPNLANFSTNNIIVNGPDPGIVPGDDEEATLDVDMVGSAAPNANILLVVNGGTLTGNLALVTDPTDGVDQSALYIVTNNLAPVMSESFGSCEQFDDTLFSSTLWEQAAAQGITVFVSTGDNGSAGCDPDLFPNASDLGLNVSGTASTPFNVAVGGTDFNDASNPGTYWNATNGTGLESAKSYIPEIPWNGTCASTATTGTLTTCSSIDPTNDPNTNPVPPNETGLSGGSGGQSSCGVQDFTTQTCTGYPKPAWQSAPGVPADGVRDLPDVSLFAAVNTASNQFYIFCLADSPSQNGQPCSLTGANQNFSGVGGTSASTPAVAGIMALVNQSEVAAGRSGRQGNANYVLYKLATAQGTTPGTSACAASSAAPNAACTFNDITQGNNSAACVGSFNGQSAFGLSNTPNCSTQTLNAVGVLVEPSTPSPFSATTPAWTATAGYDLATGLGSPNVTNLIANWATVTTNFKAATPAITSPPSNPASGSVSITHGQSQAFTITVTGSGGTPTGDVSLIAEPPGFGQVGVGSGTLSNGTVTITTNMLPGDDTTGAGTPYPIIAHYAGDGTFGPADSQAINVTVNREGTTTTETLFNEDLATGALTATTSVQYGTNYIMIVNVVGATVGTTCNNTSPTSVTQIPAVPCPTGTITLKDNGQPLNDFVETGANHTNISSVGNLGFVEDLLIQLAGGSHPIVASYSGDNSYNSSSSTNGAFTVTAAPTQTVVTLNGLSSTSVPAGANVALVATVTTTYTQACATGTCTSASNGVGPTGTITFSSCGTASSCTVPVVPTAFNNINGSAFATATLNTSFNTTPGAPITATFTSGDANYANCTTASSTCTLSGLTLTVGTGVGAANKLAFVTQPSTVATGAAIAPAVQVAIEDSNGNIVSSATNSVTMAIGTNPGTGTLGGTVTVAAAKGIATFSNLTLSAAGTGYTLAATSGALTGATSLAFNVLTPPAKLAFVVAPSNTNAGAPIVPAVQVQIEDSNGNLVATARNSVTVAIGTNPGSGTLGGTLTVAASAGVAIFPSLSISAPGTGYTLTASSSGLTSATSPAFNILATATQLAFVKQPSNTTVGKSIVPAVQVAVEDANGNVVGGASNPITVAIGTNPGTGTLGGTATVNAFNGVATFSNLTISAVGNSYTLAAAATGLTAATSATFNVGASTNPSFTVSAPAQATTLSSSSGASVGTTITVTPSAGFTGTVAVAASGLPPGVTCPNSPVNISVTGANAATGTLNCQVTAHSTTLTASNFLLESHDGMLDAKASPVAAPAAVGTGKGWIALSAGAGFAAFFLIFIPGGRKRLHAALGLGLICLLTLTIGCNGVGSGGGGGGTVATVTKLTVPQGTEPSGTAFTFSVTVTGGTPTGMVQLFDGATAIGTAAAVSGGTATPIAPALSVGTHAISAHYLGDSKTMASQSGTLNLTSTGSASFTITGTSGTASANTTVNVTVQ